MQSWVQGIDETPCDILCPELGRTRSAYLYAQYGDAAHPYVCFAFASHKDEENVRRIVGDYEGYLQSDAYICYELIAAASGNRIIAVGCWAHARRKFEPLIEAGPHPQAAWILGEIQKLYDIEDRARDMTDDQRLALRQAESRPIVTGIKAWLDARDQDELPKSPLRAGVNYLRNRWEAFERFSGRRCDPHRQQSDRSHHQRPGHGQEGVAVFRQRERGRDGGRLLHADDDLQAALHRRAGVLAGCLPPDPHRHAGRTGIASARSLDPNPSGSPGRAACPRIARRRCPQTPATRPATVRRSQRLATSTSARRDRSRCPPSSRTPRTPAPCRPRFPASGSPRYRQPNLRSLQRSR